MYSYNLVHQLCPWKMSGHSVSASLFAGDNLGEMNDLSVSIKVCSTIISLGK